MIKHIVTRHHNYNVKSFSEYVDNKLTTYITYDPNGNITHKRTPSTLENYQDGKPHGEIITYHDNGNIHLHKWFNMGKLVLEKSYYVTGEIILLKNYDDNGNIIKSKNFDIDGSLNFKLVYNPVENSSVRIDYHPNGKIREINPFVNNLLTGTMLKFYNNDTGNLKEICNYINYERNGLRIIFYENGTIHLISEYIKNNPILEKTKCYDQNNLPIDLNDLDLNDLL